MTTLKTITVPALGAEFPAQGGIFLGLMRGDPKLTFTGSGAVFVRRGEDSHFETLGSNSAFRISPEDYGLILCTDPAGAFKDIPWGPRDVDVPAARSDYDGLANTLAMAEAGLDLAKRITGLSCGGHTDWYLPSRQELRLAYVSAPKRFETDDWYWSSTLTSDGYAWHQDFYDGSQSAYYTDDEGRAVAVRRFALGA